ncbi:MAG TPA: protein kinase [Urbifossiella sp.]|nr:protein kinase [Urbifossiella sp.]
MDEAEPHLMSIFSAALEYAQAGERGAYLDRACDGSPALRGRVEALLVAHARAGDFLGRGAADQRTQVGRSPAADDAAWPPAAARVVPGTLISDRYELVERIGEGGMGEVWLAEQTNPVRRRVAVKLVRSGMETGQVLARFEAERQALALMDHPNIARVYDAGATPAGRPYFVMELVTGAPITRYCDAGRLPTRARLALFADVCRAVQHAHQKGVIHRDLKPSNVLVADCDGRPVPKVIDFGVAKAAGRPLADAPHLTAVGLVVGTPEYMSPEQAELNNPDVDTRSDVYALGVLLYELLTGSTPITRERAREVALLEVLHLVRHGETPRPSTRLDTAPELPGIAAVRGVGPSRLARLVRGELDWIVMKALEKDRTRRYGTADGLARDVERYLADEPVLACPPSAGYRLRKFARRNKAAVTMALVGSVLLIAVAGVSAALAAWATRAERLAESRLSAERSERERAVEAERDGKRKLVAAKLAQARAGRLGRRPGQRIDGLAALAEAAGLARELGAGEAEVRDLRDEMAACLALTDVRRGWVWPGLPPGSDDRVGFDGDLRRYARSDIRGGIEVREVEGDRLLVRLPGLGVVGEPSGAVLMRFSPDGSLLAVCYRHPAPGRATNLLVWDWRAGRVAHHPPEPARGEAAAAFSPDGRRLAACLADGTVAVYETDGWRETARLSTGVARASLAFHPDGERLAVADNAGSAVQVWALAPGRLERQVTVPARDDVGAGGMYAVAWHPAGTVLAAGCRDTNVYLWDAATGKPYATLRGHQNAVVGVAFAPAGDYLLSTAWDDSSRFWNPWTGRELNRFAGDTRHLSRDGGRAAGRVGADLAVWEIVPGEECRVLGSQSSVARTGITGWDISPDGRWLAAGGSRVRFWDLVRGTEAETTGAPAAAGLRFHPSRPELFTSRSDGVYRWTFGVGDRVDVSPLERLAGSTQLRWVDVDAAGRRLIATGRGGAVVLDPADRAAGPLRLDHPNAATAAASPDGSWVATATFHGQGVRVWDARTGRRVAELHPDARITRVAFSPDGRWLATATGTEFAVWASGTWAAAHRFSPDVVGDLPGPLAFSGDGAVLAVATSLSTIQLLEVGTWRPLVRLQEPDEFRVELLKFTPDGGRLVTSTESETLRVWDLRLFRDRLAAAGLDWDRPPFPALPPTRVTPLRVEVDSAALGRLARPE